MKESFLYLFYDAPAPVEDPFTFPDRFWRNFLLLIVGGLIFFKAASFLILRYSGL